MPKFDLTKLKVRIFEKNLTQEDFANLMGWSNATCYYKLSGKRLLTQEDIYRAIDVLEIDPEQTGAYFFERINQ